MRVTISIEHDGEEIELSDRSDETRSMDGTAIVARYWTNGEPDELIDRVVAKAKAAYHTGEKES